MKYPTQTILSSSITTKAKLTTPRTLSSNVSLSPSYNVTSTHMQQTRNIVGMVSAIDKRLYRWAKGLLPKISHTEQIALQCGTIGFDRDIFDGTPSLRKLNETYVPKLTKEEQDFLNKEVNTLCSMINDHDVSLKKDFSKDAWDYMRSKGFFGMKIPKQWGGKGFSTQAVSMVLSKTGAHSFDANATIAVPNSLGPGELLVRYGTEKQKKYFLPRLANGTLIPCFGLTGPHSGSDATSLIGSHCVVQKNDKGELGVMANFKKRYITLAPVAGVVGIGIDLKDPDNLLGDVGNEGFSVALLERGHPGLKLGPRHMPLNAAFMNGIVEGDNVWIPMSMMLGGQERCGFGWNMFVEALAEGRGVCLPAGAVGAARAVASACGAYTRVRKQFKVPIAEFGGIQEALACAGSDGLTTIAGSELMNAIIDNHEAPMVISSVMKQNCTERGRRIAEKGMDIAAGSAICRGDNNYIGNAYMNMPIAITVEGANIMTRSFQIIGQGLTRCHPHMVDLLQSLQAPEHQEKQSIDIFAKKFNAIVCHGTRNFFGSISKGIGSTVSTKFRSVDAYKNGNKLLEYHEKQLLRLSNNFALTADLCFTLGGRLKFEELLMGRLADALGAIYLGYATLHHYTRRRGLDGLEALTEHAMLRLETEAQDALKTASDNFPGPLGTLASGVMKFGCFPLGSASRPYQNPPDTLTKEVSRLMSTPSDIRSFFQENMYVAPEETKNQVSELIRAVPICFEADKISAALRKDKRSPTPTEAEKLAKAEALRDVLIQVNVFEGLTDEEEKKEYIRPALQGTNELMAKLDKKRYE